MRRVRRPDAFFFIRNSLLPDRFRFGIVPGVSTYSVVQICGATSVTQARRLLRLTLLAPAVVDNLLAETDMAINLESVLRRVMPLDW